MYFDVRRSTLTRNTGSPARAGPGGRSPAMNADGAQRHGAVEGRRTGRLAGGPVNAAAVIPAAASATASETTPPTTSPRRGSTPSG